MKINDLSKELNISNKDLISFLKENGFKASSHNQNATDEMIEAAREHFKNTQTEVVEPVTEEEEVPQKKVIEKEKYVPKKYNPDDMIPCRSVTPWKLLELGVDKQTLLSWNGYGDVEYVSYKNLQALRRKSLIRKPKVIIEDAELCYQWRNDLGDTYKYFIGVEFPEEFFDLSDEKFRRLLMEAPDVVKEVIKFTAMDMVRNENYPTVQKLTIIDDVLGTCIKDFL